MQVQGINHANNTFQSIRNMMRFRRNPLALMTGLAESGENLVQVPFGTGPGLYLVVNPDYVHDILVQHPDKVVKWSRQARAAQKVLGTHAMAMLEGDAWRANRRLTAPAFHTQRIAKYINFIPEHTRETTARWSDGDIVDMDSAMTADTMGIIGEILFNVRDFQKHAPSLFHAFQTLRYMLVLETSSPVPLPGWIPLPRRAREKEAIKMADDTIRDMINKRRASREDQGDVMSALLKAVDQEDGSMMDDNEVRDSLMGLFIAGHETTAVLMTWALHLLSGRLDVQERLYEEVQRVWDVGDLSFDALSEMKYADQVINETLRLYPPAWSLFLRETIEPINLGEDTIPAGAVVLISPWVIHHHSAFWVEPLHYEPDRFGPDVRYHPFTFLPFGAGPRVCAGSHLAIMEAKTILASLVKQFIFEAPDPGRVVEVVPRFTIHPAGGMPIRVLRRHA